MSDLSTGAAPAAAEPAAIANVQTAEKPLSPMESIERTMSETYDKINPPRTPIGQFKGKEPPDAAADIGAKPDIPKDGGDGAAAKTEESKDQTQTDVKVEPAQPAIDAPLSWSADMKAKWATLPPDVRAYAAQRESDAHKRISEMGQQVKSYESFAKHIEPIRQFAARMGVTEDRLVGDFVQAQHALLTEPRQAIAWLAKTYGVDLPSATAENPGDETASYIRSLEARVDRAERLAADVHSRTTAREQAENARDQASLAETIQAFAKDKPHFEKVRLHMGLLMQSGAAATMDEAYDMAIHAVPEIRQSILADQRKAEDEKRAKETAEKAKDAKRVASLNVKSTGASPAKKGTWEQTLREVGERITG